jgi:hypothetical protein
MEPIGSNEAADLVIVVPLTSLVSHLNARWLAVSRRADGALIMADGLEFQLCPLSSVSVIDLSPRSGALTQGQQPHGPNQTRAFLLLRGAHQTRDGCWGRSVTNRRMMGNIRIPPVPNTRGDSSVE